MTAYAVDCRQVSFLFAMKAGETMDQCDVRSCKHNHNRRCDMRQRPAAGRACQSYEREADNRTALVHGPVKSGNRHRFFR